MAAPAEPTTESFRDLYVKLERCRQVLEAFQDGSAHVLKCELNGSGTAWSCDIETGRHTTVTLGLTAVQAHLALVDVLTAIGLIAPDQEP